MLGDCLHVEVFHRIRPILGTDPLIRNLINLTPPEVRIQDIEQATSLDRLGACMQAHLPNSG